MKRKPMNKLISLFFTFFKIGAFTFGGGLAMLPFIHSEMVEKKSWITDEEMMDIIAVAESTPGVIAVNTATFVGYKVGKFWGSLVATVGVVLPSLIIICVISLFFEDFLTYPIVAAVFKGIRVGVTVLIFNAAIKIFKKSPKTVITYSIIALSIILSIFTPLDSILIIILGALIAILSQVVLLKKGDKND